jgi:TonB family protein
MVHGSSGYFVERARFERRVSLFMVGVAVSALALQIVVLIPGVRARLTKSALIDPMRWGFEGPEQYVKRIVLQTSGRGGSLNTPVVTYIPRQALAGGARRMLNSDRTATPEPRRIGIGPGDSPEDLLTRARQIYRRAPVVQSEDLIIERLVRPTYPEDANQRHIGGRVAVMALVDTTGHVVRVDVMNSSGEGQLDRAATEAVWSCRFLPYLHGGHVQEVYALFTFNFLPD